MRSNILRSDNLLSLKTRENGGVLREKDGKIQRLEGRLGIFI